MSPLASFTRFMMAVTAAFAVLCALLAWSAVLALTSFGAAAYLPRPVPLPLSPSSCLYVVLWTIGLWHTWKTPPAPPPAMSMAAGEAASEVQTGFAAAQPRRVPRNGKDTAAMTATASSASDGTIELVVVNAQHAGVAAVDSRP